MVDRVAILKDAMFFNNLCRLMLSFLPFTEAGTNLTQEPVSEINMLSLR